MKLESKLGLSTGFLIAAMFLSAYTAHIRIEEANHLSDIITTNRLPLIMGSRDLRSHFTDTIRALESYMLFGIDPNSSIAYRNSRREQFEQAELSLAKLRQDSSHFDLGSDAARLSAIETGLAALKPLEEKVETLNESKTSQGTAQAYDTLQSQILPLERNMFKDVTDLAQSQMSQTNGELERLRRANHSTLLTLWLATILGALVGGIVSFLLARRITHAVSLVAERANCIAAGDLTGEALDLHSHDQIGTLAVAMQQMQNNLSSIIGTVVQTAGSLTSSAASMAALRARRLVLRAISSMTVTIWLMRRESSPRRPTVAEVSLTAVAMECMLPRTCLTMVPPSRAVSAADWVWRETSAMEADISSMAVAARWVC